MFADREMTDSLAPKRPLSGTEQDKGVARRKRRNHPPTFKAKVAIAAVKGDKTLTELAQQFDIHPN